MEYDSDLLAELSPHRRTDPVAEIEPVKPVREEEEAVAASEKNFLSRLQGALQKLKQRDDLRGYRFEVDVDDGIGLIVLMFDPDDRLVARFKAERAIAMAEQRSSDGLMIKAEC